LRHVVTVGGAEDYRNRDALCVRKKVMLRACSRVSRCATQTGYRRRPPDS
jgi:hypothetical protein